MRRSVPHAPVLPAIALAALSALARAEPPRADDIPGAAPRGVVVTPGDTCAAAGVIPALPFMLNFNNDLFTAGAPRGTCNAAGTTVMQNDAWLRWTAPFNATVTLTVDTLGYDGIAVVHQGASCGGLTAVACADEPEPTVITFTAATGQTYWFQLGDWGTTEQGGSTTVTIGVQAIPGETCASAAQITFTPFETTFDNNLFAASAPPGACNTGDATLMQNDAWYRWTAPDGGLGVVEVSPTGYDALLALTPIACIDEPQPMTLTFPLIAGTTYWFQTGDRGVTEGGGPTGFSLLFIPPGEVCDTAVPITSTPFFDLFNNDASTADGPAGLCNGGGATAMQNDHWYRWTAPVSTPVRVCVNAPAYDGVLQVYSGNSCTILTFVTCADEPEPCTVAFNAVAGTTYWFQAGDWGVTEGGGVTDFTLVACTGDANFDGAVDFNDIAAILANWLFTYPSCVGAGDANLDATVDFNDITAVLANWLADCP